MAEVSGGWADRLVRWTTTGCVLVLAGIAAVISYRHMFVLVQRYGETSWTAALLPVPVDGMIVASSMSLLADSRAGRHSSLLPWVLLVIGSTASLSANVAVAEPSVVGRLIAAWPSCALIGAYELLMRQVRQGSQQQGSVAARESPYEPTDLREGSYKSHPASYMGLIRDGGASAEDHGISDHLSNGSDRAQRDSAPDLARDVDEALAYGAGEGRWDRQRHGQPVSDLQRQAWRWAVTHRTSAGNLPSGKVIAEQFGRRERWGRLVKQAGVTGALDHEATQ